MAYSMDDVQKYMDQLNQEVFKEITERDANLAEYQQKLQDQQNASAWTDLEATRKRRRSTAGGVDPLLAKVTPAPTPPRTVTPGQPIPRDILDQFQGQTLSALPDTYEVKSSAQIADPSRVDLSPIGDDYKLGEQLGLAIKQGWGSTLSSLGGIASINGWDWLGNKLAIQGEQLKSEVGDNLQTYTPEEMQYVNTLEKYTNPKVWTGGVLPSAVTSSISFIPSMGIQLASTLAAGALGSTGVGAPAGAGVEIAGTAAAGVTNRVIQSWMEAGDAYSSSYKMMLQKGYSNNEAQTIAKAVGNIVYEQNLKLTPLDLAQQAATFLIPGGKSLKTILPIGAAKIGSDMYLEGIEELAQGVIQNQAMNLKGTSMIKDVAPKIFDPSKRSAEEQMSMTVGQMMGGFTGAMGVPSDMYKAKQEQNNEALRKAMADRMGQITNNVPSAGTNTTFQGTRPATIPSTTPPTVPTTLQGTAQEEAAQQAPNIPAPTRQATPEPVSVQGQGTSTGTTAPAMAPTTTGGLIPQDVVQDIINRGGSKEQSWGALQQYYGNNIDNVISKDEHDNLYDAVIDYNKEIGPVENVTPETVAPAPTNNVGEVTTNEPPLSAPRVQEIIENHFKTKLPDNSYEVYTGPRTSSMVVAETLAKVFGHKTLVVTPTHSGANKFNGFINHASGTIVLSSNAHNPMHVVMMHELTHSMEKKGQSIYKALREDINESIGVAGGVQAWYNDKYAKGTGKTWESLDESSREHYFREFTADLMQEVSTVEGFFNQLLMKSVDTAQAFLNSIDELLAKLRGESINQAYSVKPYIEFWEQAQEACQNAMAEYLSQAHEGKLKDTQAVKWVESNKKPVKKAPKPNIKVPEAKNVHESQIKKTEEEKPEAKVEEKKPETKIEEKKLEVKKEEKTPEEVNQELLDSMTPKDRLKHLEDALHKISNPVSGTIHEHSIGTPKWNAYNKRINELTEQITELKKEIGKQSKSSKPKVNAEEKADEQRRVNRQHELASKYRKDRLQKFAKDTDKAIEGDTQLSLRMRLLEEQNYGPQAAFIRGVEPFNASKLKGVINRDTLSRMKPGNSAFWTSTFNGKDSVSDWGIWTLDELFYRPRELDEMGIHVLVPDPKANILHLKNAHDVTKLVRTYGMTVKRAREEYTIGPSQVYKNDPNYITWIDWEEVSKHYDAVHFTKEFHNDSYMNELFATDVESTAWLRPNPNFIEVSAIDKENYRIAYDQIRVEEAVDAFEPSRETPESIDELREMVKKAFKGKYAAQLLARLDNEDVALSERMELANDEISMSEDLDTDIDDIIDGAVDRYANEVEKENNMEYFEELIHDMTDAELRESMEMAQDVKDWAEVALIKEEWARRYKAMRTDLKKLKKNSYYYNPEDELLPYKYPPIKITHEEERQLGHQAKAGDKDALTKLLSAHSGFVYTVAKRYIMNKHSLTLDDLVQEGMIGLAKTIIGKSKKGRELYTPDADTRLLSAAGGRIRQAILRAINSMSSDIRIPERHSILYGHVLRLKKEYEEMFNEPPSMQDLFDMLKDDTYIKSSDYLSGVANLIVAPDGQVPAGKMSLTEFIENQRRLSSLNELVNDEEGEVEKHEMMEGPGYAEFMREVQLDELKDLINRGIDSLIPENPKNNERTDWADLVRAKYFPEEVFGEEAWELINIKTGTVDDGILGEIFVKEDGEPATKSAIGKKLKRIYDTLRKTAEIQQAWDMLNEEDAQMSEMLHARDVMESNQGLFSDMFNHDVMSTIELSDMVKDKKFIKSVAESDIFTPEFINELGTSKYTPGHFDEWINAALEDIKQGLDKAIDKFYSDNVDAGYRTTLGLYIAKALHEKSAILSDEGKPLESVRMNTQAMEILRDTADRLTKAGQEVAAAKILQKMDTASILTRMHLDHNKMFNGLKGKLQEEITNEAKIIAEGMQKVNEEAIEQVLDELGGDITSMVANSLTEKKTGRKHSADENDAILHKVEEHINMNENPDTPINKIVKTIHDMFGKWFKRDTQLSTNQFKMDSYVLELVNRCLNMNQYIEVKQAWETQLRPNLRKQYGKDFSTPQEFFNYAINQPEIVVHIDELTSSILEDQGKSIDDIISDKDVRDLANLVAKRVRPGLKPTIETRIRKMVNDNKKDAAARLAKRLINMASPRTEVKRTKISEMLQMISRVAKETLPKTPRVPVDPMDAIVAAINNFREYQKMWMAAEAEIMRIYNDPKAKTDISEEVKTLQEFFNRPIDKVIPNAQLERMITRGLREEGMTVADVVKQHYTQQRFTMRTLAEKLVEQVNLKAEGLVMDDMDGLLGLMPEDAIAIANMIQDRFDQVVLGKKQKMLEGLFKKAKPSKRQQLIDRIIMYSNLGAFSENQYIQAVCERLGIPAITPEMTTQVMDLCNRMQNTVYDVVRPVPNKNAERYYEIRRTKDNTWILMINEPMPYKELNALLRGMRIIGDRLLDNIPMIEIGEYRTMSEAMAATPDDVQWRDFMERGGVNAQNELIMELHYILADLRKPNIWEKVSTIQTIAMLLSIVTSMRNIIGNESIYWTKSKIEKLITVPIDVARCKLTGKDRTITFARNSSGRSYAKGLLTGITAASRGWTPRGLEGQYELGFAPRFKRYSGIFEDGWFPTFTRINKVINTGMSYLETAMRISLLGMDQAAVTRALEDKMTEEAALFLINNGQKVTRENIQKTIANMEGLFEEIAIAHAKKMTFQNDNKLTKLTSEAKRGLNKASTLGITSDFGAGDVIIKFTKVPVNLSILAWEFSPFGLINCVTHAIMARNAASADKGKHIALATEHFADAMIGLVGFTGFGVWAGMMGFLTGRDDDDEKRRAYNRSTGRGTYRANMSAMFRYIGQKLSGKPTTTDWRNGDWICQYSWAEPVATSTSIGVEIGKKWAKGEKAGYADLIAGLGALFDKSVFENMLGLFEVPPGEQLSGETLINNVLTNFVTNAPASFVPAISRQTRVWMDPYARVYWEGDLGDQAKAKMMDRIPSLSEKLRPQQDVFGNPIQRNVGMPSHTLPTALLSYISPMYVNKYEIPSSTARTTIEELYKRTNNTDALPSSPNKSVQMDKVTYKLTEDEYTELKRYRGEEIDRLISESFILKDPQASDAKKIERLKKIYEEAGGKAINHIKKQLKVSRGIS